MRRRIVLVASAILIAASASIAFAEGVLPSNPNSGPSLHTTSVDIQVLNVIPAIEYQPNVSTSVVTGVGLNINQFAQPVNVTSSFAFAPIQAFAGANSVLVTIVYFGGLGGYDGLQVSLNGHSFTNIPATTVQNTVVGSLSNQDIRNGANTINIGLSPTTPGQEATTFVYQVRLTVEYSYFA